VLDVLPPARQAELTMIDRRPAIPAAIREPGVVAIARRLDPMAVSATCDGLLRGGIRALELTLNDPEDAALEALGVAVRHATVTNLCIGAGTVLSVEAARRAVDAGAAFLVSPHLDPELVAWAAGQGIAMLPGAATPTEVLAAWRAGAAGVKVFPASSLGPTFIRELRGPLPDVPLMPTGGVTVESAGDFVRAGAVAVGLGSWLFAGGAAAVEHRATQAIAAVAAARADAQSGR
jgi:2-dehydro-3-deoxyphosphogluconate aldolase/(4S)-4-hydroxy-2-oxoglutarate aldolase